MVFSLTLANYKPPMYVGLYHIIANAILTWWLTSWMVRVVWWCAQGHVNSDTCWSWDLNPGVVVQNSLLDSYLGCTLLCMMVPDSVVLWRPKLEFRELEESPLRLDFKDSHAFSAPMCRRKNYQGFQPNSHTQFQEICDKLFLCCVVSSGFNEAGFPKLGRACLFNWMRVSLFSPR